MANVRARQIYNLVTRLKLIGPTSNAPIKFIVDTTPFDDENEDLPSGDVIITGRLLPSSAIYKDGAIQIEIRLGSDFPGKPPKVCLKTQVYHPNVSKEGAVSIDLLSPSGTWTLTTSLVTVIEEITKIIDQPSLDRIQYPEAASLFDTDIEGYKRKAAEIFNKNPAPRN
jgi:ubiquitin-protein ligase